MEPDLTKTLRQKVEARILEVLPGLHNGESRMLTFEPDFHGDTFKVLVVKGYSPGLISDITGYHRTYEASRRDGFEAGRDLEWTVDAILTDLGL